MKEELEYAFGKLNNALVKLKEGAMRADDDLEKDGVIQRFEFTFELLWKTLKMFLEDKGLISRTPRDAFKEAFRLDWLGDDEEVFLNMLEDRNKTVHVYDEKTSREIFTRIKNYYISAIEKVLGKMGNLPEEKGSEEKGSSLNF